MSRVDLEGFVAACFPAWQGELTPMGGGGSDRAYYRFRVANNSYVLTHHTHKAENQAFLYMAEILGKISKHIPQILFTHPSKEYYIQQDLGNKSLLQLQLQDPNNTLQFYKKTLTHLAELQVIGDQAIDYQKCFDYQQFDQMVVLRDLFYFKDFFLDAVLPHYSQRKLLHEFQQLAQEIAATTYQFFMFRDFQGRNVMIYNNEPYFIDFQGGMKGSCAYDVASLLWQAKAQISTQNQTDLLAHYTHVLQSFVPDFNPKKFHEEYELCVAIRLLQVLGAYGKLGLIQQKAHFLESISFGIQQLQKFSTANIWEKFPYLHKTIINLIQTYEQTTYQR